MCNALQVLHVEQEVLGDGTTATESLLACDTERSALLKARLLGMPNAPPASGTPT